ncbi:MAG TPA: hypothetical protein VGO21_00625, partial [Candidatus Paceibacterota bacterium]|nr:hypothetical protein [Candidatus Paceibacterota bacterium]
QPPIHCRELKNFRNKLVLLTYPKGYRLKNWAWEASSLLLFRKPKLRKMMAQVAILQNKAMAKIEKDKEMLVIQPYKLLPGHWLEKNAKNIAKNVGLGHIAAKDFLKKNFFNT